MSHSIPASVSTAFLDGLALAATVVRDRHGTAVMHGLSSSFATLLHARCADLGGLSRREREHELGAIAAKLRPDVDLAAELPGRARAILATEVPREVGARWLAEAPLPRAGFRGAAGLRAMLRRYAQRPISSAQTMSDREVGAKIATGAVFDLPLTDDDRANLAGVQPARDLLAPEIVRAVMDTLPRGDSVLLALGAAARGAGSPERTHDDRWARAGRETVMLHRRISWRG